MNRTAIIFGMAVLAAACALDAEAAPCPANPAGQAMALTVRVMDQHEGAAIPLIDALAQSCENVPEVQFMAANALWVAAQSQAAGHDRMDLEFRAYRSYARYAIQRGRLTYSPIAMPDGSIKSMTYVGEHELVGALIEAMIKDERASKVNVLGELLAVMPDFCPEFFDVLTASREPHAEASPTPGAWDLINRGVACALGGKGDTAALAFRAEALLGAAKFENDITKKREQLLKAQSDSTRYLKDMPSHSYWTLVDDDELKKALRETEASPAH
jgi:hypothetical protein